MKVVIAIPARFGSTRFPGKPLALIAGRPMIQWVWELAAAAVPREDIFVVTDDRRIEEAVLAFGGQAIMTSAELASGTDRIWAGLKDRAWDVVINVQGDEPLLPPEMIQTLARKFTEPGVQMATWAHALVEEDLPQPNLVKVLTNAKDQAIYFSRFPIPFSRQNFREVAGAKALRHVGIYGYRREALQAFCQEPPAWLELAESLEQLRALYLGIPIDVLTGAYQPVGVDVPGDIAIVEGLLASRRSK